MKSEKGEGRSVPIGTGEREARRHGLRRVTPPVDIYEHDEGLSLVVDLPGVPVDAVRLDVDKGVLTIVARFDADAILPGKATYAELSPCDYQRAFALRDDLDAQRITATLRDGVLELKLPKAERARTRKVPIEST